MCIVHVASFFSMKIKLIFKSSKEPKINFKGVIGKILSKIYLWLVHVSSVTAYFVKNNVFILEIVF